MNEKTTISVVQCTPKWNDRAANYQLLTDLLTPLSTDVIVLPELCTTGYSFLTTAEAEAAAETPSVLAAFFMPFSLEKRSVIVAGFAERAPEGVYNSAIIVLPDGTFRVYRKTHLFFKEKQCFLEGNTGFFTVKHPDKDCVIGVMVCYDWRFPESARTLALQGADLIVCPSNLVTTVWEIGMKARALENSVYVATANRCGTESRLLNDGSTQSLSFTGKSVLYDPAGLTLTQADLEENCVLTGEIDVLKSRNKHFNALNNIFDDRRPNFYGL
ncbi:MAG: carbon-nitrogen hydrolase [Saprospiraceae bacterium]|nr:carbon-nitrogen hydrolase [Saprospiraceae bacterium]